METQNKQTVVLDLRQTSTVAIPSYVQHDTNILEFVIKDNGVDADLSTIENITANYLRPDGVTTSRILTSIGNVVSYEFGTEEMDVPGYGEVNIQFFKDGTRLSSKRLKVYFAKSLGAAFENSAGMPLLQELFIEVIETNELLNGSEVIRQANESVRANQETARVSAENTRNSNETTRQNNEYARQTSETSRVNAETTRANAEDTREANESARISIESTRVSNETARSSAETTRQTKETERQTAETTRKNNETTRQQNETTRQTQESTRQTNTSNALSGLNTAVNNLKMNYKIPVANFAAIATTYASPQVGDIVQTTDDGKFYRWDGTAWRFNQQITSNIITDIQNRLSLVDEDTGKIYKYQFKQKDGHMVFAYEEVL